MTLTIQDLGALGELLGSVAVLVTLVYLAMQTRLNTRATQTASWNSINALLSELDLTEATDSALSKFIVAAELDPQSVSAEDFWKFSRVAQARLGVFEMSYLSTRAGTLGEYNWKGMEGFIRFTVRKPGYRAFLEEYGTAVYHPDFIAYVETILAEV